jgi:hypothetical protein
MLNSPSQIINSLVFKIIFNLLCSLTFFHMLIIMIVKLDDKLYLSIYIYIYIYIYMYNFKVSSFILLSLRIDTYLNRSFHKTNISNTDFYEFYLSFLKESFFFQVV